MAHDVPHRELTRAGPPHEARNLLARDAHHPHLPCEETRNPLRLWTTQLPAASRRDRDDAARPTPLGELERESAAHRVTDEMGGADAELVEMDLERVAGIRDLLEAHAARVLGSTAVARQRWRDHLVARDEIGEHRPPMAPVTGEPMQ